MANKIILKKSSVTGRVPVVGDLDYGELALNYADGKLWYKKSDNTIQLLNPTSSSSSYTPVLNVVSRSGLIPIQITANSFNVYGRSSTVAISV